MYLNVGSGDAQTQAPEPWVNVDGWHGVSPDVCASAERLPFADGSANAVFCGHLLEHLDLGVGVPRVLQEIWRVLVPGGTACFVGPDYDRALLQEPVDDILLGVIRDGGDRWPGDRHQWLSTGTGALAAIAKRFRGAYDVPVDRLDEFWPIHSRVGWQFAIVGRKAA